MQADTDVEPSIFGFVETSADTMTLIQTCIQGRLPSVLRRPTVAERACLAQSGHIFIYEEFESRLGRVSHL
jgi:hypothetical protein